MSRTRVVFTEKELIERLETIVSTMASDIYANKDKLSLIQAETKRASGSIGIKKTIKVKTNFLNFCRRELDRLVTKRGW